MARIPTGTKRKGPVLRRSEHLSFFRKKDEIYACHDLWGYLLQMDERVHAFIESFGHEGRAVREVAADWAERLRPEEIEGFVGTFRQHRCLVAPREDEKGDAFQKGYPCKAAWIVAWQGGAPHARGRADGAEEGRQPPPFVDVGTVLAYKDRGLRRVALERLDQIGAQLFARANGEHTLAEIAALIAKELGQPLADVAAEVRRVAFRLTHSDRQVLKLTDRPLYEYLAFAPPYLRSTMPFARMDDPAASAEAPDVVDLTGFHRAEIEDAQAQFDLEETTLSHMFRDPHDALGGKSYGEAFAAALRERGLLKPTADPRAVRILEVGGGVGFFAKRLLSALAEAAPPLYEKIRYAILDLSQVLQDSQRMLNYAGDGLGKPRFVLGNASRSLPVRDGALDLVLSNEVIADFETVRLRRADIAMGSRRKRKNEHPSLSEARAMIRRFDLPIDDAPEQFWLNFGALRFVEELARALRPGGAAVLVEFGGLSRYPVESTHLAHSEFSIHFGHLQHVAERCGLLVEITDIMEFLAMRGDIEVLATTRTYFECLRALLERRGVSLQKLAYTESDFRELLAGRVAPGALPGLSFKPVRERALGLHPPEFLVAILRKPR